LIVDRKSARYIDCKNLSLPFGPQFVEDIVNRTQVAQSQAAALLATELVLKGQKSADALAAVTSQPFASLNGDACCNLGLY
jgi:hypothetical protein